MVHLRRYRAAGGLVWVLDTRRTETAAHLGRALVLRPGSDTAVLGWLGAEFLRSGADQSELIERCRAEEVAAIGAAQGDLTGRIAVVTEANGGLGLETACALVGAGAHVVLGARDPDKTVRARAEIFATVPHPDLEMVPLDLALLASIAAAAEAIEAAHDRIDMLVSNAGLMAMRERKTADGFEMQLGVNHLGHWALTSRLAADPGRQRQLGGDPDQHRPPHGTRPPSNRPPTCTARTGRGSRMASPS